MNTTCPPAGPRCKDRIERDPIQAKWRNSHDIEKNVQTVKDFFAAIGRGDRQALLALVAEDIEWIIPGENWPLAGTHRGHAGLANLIETASMSIETSTEPREFVAQGDRVLVVGFARGKIKPRTRHSRTTGSSPSRSGTANWRASGNTSTRKHWRGPRRWTRRVRRSAGRLRHGSASKVNEPWIAALSLSNA